MIRSLTERGKSIVFISHKLNEVLAIADRITVLRRGKLIETLPAAGATEESLARLMVGRDVLLRVAKTPAHPAEPLLESRTCASSTSAGSRRCGHLARRARRRDRRHRRHRRQRADRADRRDDRPPPGRVRGRARRRPRRHCGVRPRASRSRARAHPRRPTASRSGARVLDRRERRVARLPIGARLAPRVAVPAPHRGAGPRTDPRFDVRGGGPTTRAGGLSGGNQQKVVLAREIDRNPKLLSLPNRRAGSTSARSSSSTGA